MYNFLPCRQQYRCLISNHQTSAYENTFPPLSIFVCYPPLFFVKSIHLWWTFLFHWRFFLHCIYWYLWNKTRSIIMKAKKILSIFCIALILFLFGCTLFLAITNSPYFMGCLFLSFITPIIIYVFVWLYKLTHPAKDNHSKEETK